MNPNFGNSFAAWLGRIPFGDNAGSGHNWNGLLSNTDGVFAPYTMFEPAIRAAATMTLALPKTGLHAPRVGANVGDLYLADISVPPRFMPKLR